MPARECSRTACSNPAVSSLTFVYEDSTAVLGPLSRTSEPHAYDLCRDHAARMTAPRGWELLRVAGGEGVSDDLVALADAVRRTEAPLPAGTWAPSARPAAAPASHRAPAPGREAARHLHVVRGGDD
ncbi:DUF3499 domain-containing protein [Brachybacterium sp. J144]|uniref:DUF3499 domain-containing protein n=1 Tax=Brachybacterium sp. J144 TaxID=3116487 RepID=UPI002E77D6F8|nr:DUF3499 domain-containing protein [Brachybacterium sp. J144]MEE1649596.1 DUF3499 domain-containing protein [Brachybacterium sp. J144]